MPNRPNKFFNNSNPLFWWTLSVAFYAVFEILNATIVCRSTETTIWTGLFSFLGFVSLAASVITLIIESQVTRRFSWIWWLIAGLIVALFLVDFYLGRTCFYN